LHLPVNSPEGVDGFHFATHAKDRIDFFRNRSPALVRSRARDLSRVSQTVRSDVQFEAHRANLIGCATIGTLHNRTLKLQKPKSKLQSKFKTASSKRPAAPLGIENWCFGISLEFGTWDLELSSMASRATSAGFEVLGEIARPPTSIPAK
jgi:hypothetical protein